MDKIAKYIGVASLGGFIHNYMYKIKIIPDGALLMVVAYEKHNGVIYVHNASYLSKDELLRNWKILFE